MEVEPHDEEEERPFSRGGTGCSVETVMREWERETAARRREPLRAGSGLGDGAESFLLVESCLSARREERTEAMRRMPWRFRTRKERGSWERGAQKVTVA